MLFRFLDQSYDQYKRNYAEILYRWDMHSQRTEVMKYCSDNPNEYRAWGELILFPTCRAMAER